MNNPWELMRELASMQERMNRVWARDYDHGRGQHEDVTSRGHWLPPVDIYENDQHELVLRAELPGVRREDIDVTVEHNVLTLRGDRRRDDRVKDSQYHRAERAYGAFSRSFTLPATIDGHQVRADYRDGMLTVTLPLRIDARPRQIQVEVQD
jgi:HSP20 family protein